MAQQIINIGSRANSGGGDPLRTAMDKINDNFTELYARDVNTDAQTLTLVGNTLSISGGNSVSLDISPTGDLTGSVFADDSTLLVDGINSSINLDGTVKGDIVPDTDVAYDIGSASNRFRDLYLSGSTIDLGGTTLSIVGGELQLGGVKIPTQAEVTASIASAVAAPTGDLTGSVFADDSTLLVDGVNGSIPYSVISDVQVTESDLLVDWAGIVGTQIQTNGLPINTFTNGDLEVRGTLSAEDGSDLELSSTNDVNINTSVGDENHKFEFKNDGTFYMAKNPVNNTSYISTPRNDDNASLTLSSATDLIIETNVGPGTIPDWTFAADGSLTFPDGTTQSTAWNGVGDLTGSVFADDSTLLVDGVNGRIVGAIDTTAEFVGDGFININNDAYGGGQYAGFTTDKLIFNIQAASRVGGGDNGGAVMILGGNAQNSGNNGGVLIATGAGGTAGTADIDIRADGDVAIFSQNGSITFDGVVDFTNATSVDLSETTVNYNLNSVVNFNSASVTGLPAYSSNIVGPYNTQYTITSTGAGLTSYNQALFSAATISGGKFLVLLQRGVGEQNLFEIIFTINEVTYEPTVTIIDTVTGTFSGINTLGSTPITLINVGETLYLSVSWDAGNSDINLYVDISGTLFKKQGYSYSGSGG